MKRLSSSLLLVAAALSAGALEAAFADTVNFYEFRLKYDSSAAKRKEFDAVASKTNLYDPAVRETRTLSCEASPFVFDPGDAICWPDPVSERKGLLLLADRPEDALALAKTIFPTFTTGTREEITRESSGRYQLVGDRSEVVHVDFAPPYVWDDSLKCRLAHNLLKKTASLRCKSEVNPDDKGFSALDLPARASVFGDPSNDPAYDLELYARDAASGEAVLRLAQELLKRRKVPGSSPFFRAGSSGRSLRLCLTDGRGCGYAFIYAMGEYPGGMRFGVSSELRDATLIRGWMRHARR